MSLNAQHAGRTEEQAGYQKEGRHSLSFHLGYPSIQRILANSINDFVDFQFSESGPYHLKYQYRAGRIFEWGMMLNFQRSVITWTDSSVSTNGDARLGARINGWNSILRLNLHFLEAAQHNLYLGMGLGLGFWKVSPIGIIPVESITINVLGPLRLRGVLPAAELVLGYRAFINRQIGLSAELGITKAIFQVGMTYRFNRQTP